MKAAVKLGRIWLMSVLMVTQTWAVTHQEIRDELDQAMRFKREGQAIPIDILKGCFDSFKTYADGLFEKHGHPNTNFPEPDRTEFYVNCVRAGMVMPLQHGGWVQRSTLRLMVYKNLVEQAKKTVADKDENPDAARVYGYFLPAYQRGDVKLAVETYELMRKLDPFYADAALLSSYDSETGVCWVEAYYRNNKQEEKAQKTVEAIKTAMFPDGMRQVKLADFKDQPGGGLLIFRTNPDTVEGIEEMDVVVAIDGIRTTSDKAYQFIRNQDLKNPEMKLIIWRDGRYIETTIQAPGRMMKVETKNYFPRFE